MALDTLPVSRPRTGLLASPLLLATFGILLLTLMDGVVKGLMQTHPLIVVLCLRFVAGGMAALTAVAVLKPPKPTPREVRANLLRIPLVVLTAGSFFYAVKTLPLAEAIGLSFLAPCFIAVLGVVWLRERMNLTIVFALAAGFGGMCVMLWPQASQGLQGSTLGVLAAIFSAFTYAVNIILLRKLAVSQHPATIVTFQNLGPALVMLPAALWFWSGPTWQEGLMFLLAGCLGTVGHLTLTAAYGRAEAARLAPTEYTSLVWAALIGLFVFAEVPTLYTVAGCALIVCGSLALMRR